MHASIHGWFDRFYLLIYLFFTFFHAVSSLSQDSLTKSSSALSPFDPFLAIDRSYTTCFRSKKVRNSKSFNIPETKRNETKQSRTAGTRDQLPKKHSALLSVDSRLRHNIRCQIWPHMVGLLHGMMVQACQHFFPRVMVFFPFVTVHVKSTWKVHSYQ